MLAWFLSPLTKENRSFLLYGVKKKQSWYPFLFCLVSLRYLFFCFYVVKTTKNKEQTTTRKTKATTRKTKEARKKKALDCNPSFVFLTMIVNDALCLMLDTPTESRGIRSIGKRLPYLI